MCRVVTKNVGDLQRSAPAGQILGVFIGFAAEHDGACKHKFGGRLAVFVMELGPGRLLPLADVVEAFLEVFVALLLADAANVVAHVVSVAAVLHVDVRHQLSH